MSSTLQPLQIHQMTFGELLTGNRVLKVPPYQRTLSWPQKEWQNLFDDIVNVATEGVDNRNHLFQMFQFRKIDEDGFEYEIGDGQQRITQVVLFLLALLRKAKEMRNDPVFAYSNEIRSALDALIQKFGDASGNTGYLYVKDGSARFRTSELYSRELRFLMAEVGELDAYSYTPDETSLDSPIDMIHKFYFERISARMQISGEGDDEKSALKRLLSLEKSIMQGFKFSVAEFAAREQMQDSYEATNSRGISLSESELIKNYLFKFFPMGSHLRYSQESIYNNELYGWKQYERDTEFAPRTILTGGSPSQDAANMDELLRLTLKAYRKRWGKGKGNVRLLHEFRSFWDERLSGLNEEEVHREVIDLLRNIRSGYFLMKRLSNTGMGFGISETTTQMQMSYFRDRAATFLARSVASYGPSNVALRDIIFSLNFQMQKHQDVPGVLDKKNVDGIFDALHSFLGSAKLADMSYQARSSNGNFKHFSSACQTAFNVISYASADDLKANDFKFHLLLLGYGIRDSRKQTVDDFMEAFDHLEHGEKMYSFWKNLLHDMHLLNSGEAYLTAKHNTLEHLMPQSTLETSKGKNLEWPIEDGADRLSLVRNFGNYFLITPDLNAELGNGDFYQKRDILERKVSHDQQFKAVFEAKRWGEQEIKVLCKERKELLQVIYHLADLPSELDVVGREAASVLETAYVNREPGEEFNPMRLPKAFSSRGSSYNAWVKSVKSETLNK